jgi:hypothetical protein
LAAKKTVPRTVQYWRLVDGRTGERVKEQKWDEVLRKLHGSRHTFVIDKREHAGTITSHQISDADLQNGLDAATYKKAKLRSTKSITHSITIAAGKDFVPNQEHVKSGSQKPMQLENKDWEPVDNLFVWFVPFGNIFAVLAESTSSSRAKKFAEWLTKASKPAFEGFDDDFVWDAKPVVDEARKELLKKAGGLKSVVYAGEMGNAITKDASGVEALFGIGSKKNVTALRVEIKITPVAHKGTVEDQKAILDWYDNTIGPLQGKVDKAQVIVAENEEMPQTEIDLLEQRLTRSTTVTIQNGDSRAFTAESALKAMINAFVKDKHDLLRLRKSDD